MSIEFNTKCRQCGRELDATLSYGGDIEVESCDTCIDEAEEQAKMNTASDYEVQITELEDRVADLEAEVEDRQVSDA